jgi:histidine ammonia-lyase
MLNLAIENNVANKISAKQLITIGAHCKLTLADAKLLACNAIPVGLSHESHPAILSSYHFLQTRIDQRLPVYGVNTNFGDQVNLIDPYLNNENAALYYESINLRQTNIIKSLACGLGHIVSKDIVKVAMMLRAHCLAQGYSGVRPEAVESILSFLNADIIPIVRCYGSIGASGDLIPLAMIAAGIIGENVPVLYRGEMMMAPKAIELARLKKFQPELRDGLAMINGTSMMAAIASVAAYDLNRLFNQTLSAIAMALEAMLVISSAYDPLVHQLKNHSGEMAVNQFLINFWKDSRLLTDLDDFRHNDIEKKRVQDYYSLRSISQGFGPFKENLDRAITWIENEMNSVNDNPIIDTVENKIHHSANFMGYYVTDACDILKMNISQASTWLHALLANMIHPRKNRHLPTNLVSQPEKNNGFRSMQLLAAALAVQNRKLAQSHQAYMVPTEGDNQDVNSLGTHAAFDLQESVANLERLTAILFLAAAQALELRGIEKASDNARHIYHIIRAISPQLESCHPMTEEIGSIVNLLKEEKI